MIAAAEPLDGCWLSALIWAQILSTGSMIGLIWFVQIVHYPLFLAIPRTDFSAYEKRHTLRTGFVAAPLMLAELGSAAALFFLDPSLSSSAPFRWSLLALALIWLSTFGLQVPLHRRLESRCDERDIRRLVATNWIRTVLWSARGLLLAVAMGFRVS